MSSASGNRETDEEPSNHVPEPTESALSSKSDKLNNPSKIRLRSSDGIVFPADLRAVQMSGTLRNMLQSCSTDESSIDTEVPVDNVHSTVLAKVLEWCHYYQNHNEPSEPVDRDHTEATDSSSIRWAAFDVKRRDNIPDWDAAFLGQDKEMIFELLKAANYLDIPGLTRVGSQTVAAMMKGQSPAEIREQFDLQSDLDLTAEQKMFETIKEHFEMCPECPEHK